ncbi:hypothetical protein OROHE_026521 [Orobanche hederae]
MLLLSGLSVLGFLLQKAPANQLNLENLSALKHLFGVVAHSDMVNITGGCHIFVNLLWNPAEIFSGGTSTCFRDFEQVRLLGLQFIGRLLVGLPFEKKGSKIFNISVGRSKSLSESHKKISLDTQPVFFIPSDRLFKFPQTDLLCATLFDVLLGGASPKQILLKHNQLGRQKNSRNNSEFIPPQGLPLIFRYLSGCGGRISRVKIMGDLLDLLDSYPSNIEALMVLRKWLEFFVVGLCEA